MEELAASAQEVAQLRDQIATLTVSLGCSERRVAGLVTLSSQLYISYGESSTGKSVAELSLAAKSTEVVRLTDDLAALAQAHESLKVHIATSETSAAQRIAAKDREIADLSRPRHGYSPTSSSSRRKTRKSPPWSWRSTLCNLSSRPS